LENIRSILELINTLSGSKDLLNEIFEKRKSLAFKFDLAVRVAVNEEKVYGLVSEVY